MCSDYAEPEKDKDAQEPSASSKVERYSPKAMRAMQGKEKDSQPDSETQLPKLEIKASEFSDQTRQALKDQGINDPKVVLADDSGRKAEQTTRIVLKNDGLPDGSGGSVQFKDVVPGQYKGNKGIDLIGITEDGVPYPIEVKKREIPSDDKYKTKDVEDMLESSEALEQDILLERINNPAMSSRHPDEFQQEINAYQHRLVQNDDRFDPELSTREMGGMWTRDRWLRLVEDPANRQRLLDAGVDEKYLNPDNLKHAYSKEWEEILGNRTTIIVSGDKDKATNTLAGEAVFERGSDVFVLDLEQ